MEHQQVYDRVIAGLKDEYDIKAISHLMLTKLTTLDPEETGRRLDALAPALQSILTTKLKDNAVKQELEKLQEAVQEVLRTTARLNNAFPSAAVTIGGGAGPGGLSSASPAHAPIWKSYMEFVGKEYFAQLDAADEALKSEA